MATAAAPAPVSEKPVSEELVSEEAVSEVIVYPPPFQRMMITIPSMIASTMVAVDITIANVALPHMTATLSSSREQIMWVLTSYLVAGAIATPLAGWLAGRFGRKIVMLASVLGFTLASALCGMANDLPTIVFARFLQGAFGAGLVPLSQAILLDINPPSQHAKAMAIFAVGSMAGPIIGPTLGGYLTDALSWRWVFFINVPFGIVAFFGMLAFLPSPKTHRTRFDMFGFLTISIALTAFQLVLDRGEHVDWFESNEIRITAVIAFIALWLALVHMFTAKNTFIRPELFADRNFAIGAIFSILIGIVAFATLPMIIVMSQTLLGYSALHTGIIGLPRAIGSMIAMVIVTRLVATVDKRALLIAGLLITAISMLMYAHIDLYVDESTMILVGFVQGFGGGLMFVPLSIIVFSTLAPTMRNEGAAMYALTRNVGNAIGISVLNYQLTHYVARSQAQLSENIRPDNPILQWARPDLDFDAEGTLARLSAEVGHQAAMVGDVRMYHLVFIISLAMLPLVLLMRTGEKNIDTSKLHVGE